MSLVPVSNLCGSGKRFPYNLRRLPSRVSLWLVAQYRRARFGVAPQDTWSFDTYVARVLSNGLTQLADTTHGFPNDKTEEQWDAELRWAAGCFDQIARKFDAPDNDEGLKDTALEWLRENFYDLWD